MTIPVTLSEHPDQQIAQTDAAGNPSGMRQAWQFRDGQLVPLEIDPNFNSTMPGFGEIPMDQLFEGLKPPGFGPMRRFPDRRRGLEELPIEPSDLEKTLKDLQEQMEKLNEKLDQPVTDRDAARR